MISHLARLAGEMLASYADWRYSKEISYTSGARAFICTSIRLRDALTVAEKIAAEVLPEGDSLKREATTTGWQKEKTNG